jgi:hypothetical protein
MRLVPRQLKRSGMTGSVPYYGGRLTPAQAYAASHPGQPVPTTLHAPGPLVGLGTQQGTAPAPPPAPAVGANAPATPPSAGASTPAALPSPASGAGLAATLATLQGLTEAGVLTQSEFGAIAGRLQA